MAERGRPASGVERTAHGGPRRRRRPTKGPSPVRGAMPPRAPAVGRTRHTRSAVTTVSVPKGREPRPQPTRKIRKSPGRPPAEVPAQRQGSTGVVDRSQVPGDAWSRSRWAATWGRPRRLRADCARAPPVGRAPSTSRTGLPDRLAVRGLAPTPVAPRLAPHGVGPASANRAPASCHARRARCCVGALRAGLRPALRVRSAPRLRRSLGVRLRRTVAHPPRLAP